MLPTESVIWHHHEMKIASLFTTAHSLFICVSVFSCVCALDNIVTIWRHQTQPFW